jgi:hypothetical protein
MNGIQNRFSPSADLGLRSLRRHSRRAKLTFPRMGKTKVQDEAGSDTIVGEHVCIPISLDL